MIQILPSKHHLLTVSPPLNTYTEDQIPTHELWGTNYIQTIVMTLNFTSCPARPLSCVYTPILDIFTFMSHRKYKCHITQTELFSLSFLTLLICSLDTVNSMTIYPPSYLSHRPRDLFSILFSSLPSR